jgi:hypothetical protein
MQCGPAPVLLLVGRAMQGLLVGETDTLAEMEYAIAEASSGASVSEDTADEG